MNSENDSEYCGIKWSNNNYAEGIILYCIILYYTMLYYKNKNSTDIT